MSTVTRPIEPDDAATLVDLLHADRTYLAPFEPVRDAAYLTLAGQRDVVRGAMDEAARGLGRVHVILDGPRSWAARR